MKISRYSNCWRYYAAPVNNTVYHVDNILFYENDSVLVSTDQGWLSRGSIGYSGDDITSIEIPVDEIKLKRKLKFDGTVFVMTRKDYFGDTVADLYIPAEMLGVHFVEHKIQYGQVRAIYKGDQEICISSFVKSLEDEMRAIRNEYEEIYKQVRDTDLSVRKSEDVLADIDELKELAEKYINERKRVKALTIDDIEL